MSHLIKLRQDSSRLRRIWVVPVFFLCSLFGLWGLTDLRLENRIDDWLSQEDSQAQVLQWFREQFPDDEQMIVSWEGSSLEDPRLTEFAAALETRISANADSSSAHPLISEIITPHSLIERMAQGQVDEQDALQRLEGVLVGRQSSEQELPATRRPAALLVKFPRDDDSRHSELADLIVESASAVGIDESTLLIGGSSITSGAINQEVNKALWDPHAPFYVKSVFGLSALAGVLLTFLLLKDPVLSVLVLFVAYMTSLIATSLVPWSDHAMNMVLVVMPSLVLVLTLSAAIHVANYWRHAVADQSRSPAKVAVRKALVPCVLASLTTSIGLTSLMISSLEPIRNFGMFAAIGVLISLVVVLLLLPRFLQLYGSKQACTQESKNPIWKRAGEHILNWRRPLTTFGIILFLASTFGLSRFQADTRVARYFPPDSRLTRDYRSLEQSIGGLDSLDIVVRFDRSSQESSTFFERMELIRSIQARVEQHPNISGALSLADFQEVRTPPADDAGTLKKVLYHRRSHETEARLKHEHQDTVSTFLVARNAASDVELPEAYGPDREGDELWRITAQTYVMSLDTNYRQILHDLDEIVGAAVTQKAGVSHLMTGTVALFMRTQEILLESMQTSLWIAFTVIAIVMGILLRGGRAGILATLPNMLPIGMTFGLMSWCGQVVDVGTMLTGAIALGIAVDGTLHALAWFRSALDSGCSHREAALRSLQACGPVLVQTNAVVGLSLLMLFPADLLLISRFGWVMAALLGATLVSNVVCLPILLSGPLGKLIQPQKPQQNRSQPKDVPSIEHHRRAA